MKVNFRYCRLGPRLKPYGGEYEHDIQGVLNNKQGTGKWRTHPDLVELARWEYTKIEDKAHAESSA